MKRILRVIVTALLSGALLPGITIAQTREKRALVAQRTVGSGGRRRRLQLDHP